MNTHAYVQYLHGDPTLKLEDWDRWKRKVDHQIPCEIPHMLVVGGGGGGERGGWVQMAIRSKKFELWLYRSVNLSSGSSHSVWPEAQHQHQQGDRRPQDNTEEIFAQAKQL